MDKRQRPYQIVIGQSVAEGKLLAARAMRRNMTAAERVLWRRLRKNQLGGFHFRRQQIIAGFIADFYCHRAALAVEIDGPQHDRVYDCERDRVFAEKGIAVLRFTNDQVLRDTDDVLRLILEHLRARLT